VAIEPLQVRTAAYIDIGEITRVAIQIGQLFAAAYIEFGELIFRAN